MERIIVVDTSVLLHSPRALNSFSNEKVVIPMTVLEELDAISSDSSADKNYEAVLAQNAIEIIIGNANPHEIQSGVEFPTTGKKSEFAKLVIYPDQRLSANNEVPYLDGTWDQANDNRIINVALRLQAEEPLGYVCLVSKDINMRIKAKGSGLQHVENYPKDISFDHVLYRDRYSNGNLPKLGNKKFHGFSTQLIEPDLLSIMMPFSNICEGVFVAVKKMATDIGFRCLRADSIWDHETVIEDIISLICRSRVVICDCTARNPNVFYEIGIAHAFGKDVLLITQSDDDIPADLRHYKYLKYLNNDEGRAMLASSLSEKILQLVN